VHECGGADAGADVLGDAVLDLGPQRLQVPVSLE
jgi:hypothetical protein